MELYKVITIIVISTIILVYANHTDRNNYTRALPPLLGETHIEIISSGNAVAINENSVATSESPVQCLNATGGSSHNCTMEELISMGFIEVNESDVK